MSGALLSLLLIAASTTLTPEDVTNPRQRGGWVTDAARMLPARAELSLDTHLDRIERELGVEIAVVTVGDVAGVPKDFATALFKRWGIGKAGLDNGLLVLLVQSRRRVEMETGYGLEAALPDAYLGQLQVAEMVPRLRRRDAAGALEAAIAAIETRLRAQPAAPVAAAPEAPAVLAPQRQPEPEDGVAVIVLVGLGIVVPALLLAFVLYRRRRICSACHSPLRLLDDGSELAYLSPGDRLEMQLASARHTIYRCTACPEIRHFRRIRRFSKYGDCPACTVRALRLQSHVVRPATELVGGLNRIEQDCAHCGHNATRLEHTPALPATVLVTNTNSSVSAAAASTFSSDTSSSFDAGSSGGSFGGGDSGGGGAGSSW